LDIKGEGYVRDSSQWVAILRQGHFSDVLSDSAAKYDQSRKLFEGSHALTKKVKYCREDKLLAPVLPI